MKKNSFLLNGLLFILGGISAAIVGYAVLLLCKMTFIRNIFGSFGLSATLIFGLLAGIVILFIMIKKLYKNNGIELFLISFILASALILLLFFFSDALQGELNAQARNSLINSVRGATDSFYEYSGTGVRKFVPTGKDTFDEHRYTGTEWVYDKSFEIVGDRIKDVTNKR